MVLDRGSLKRESKMLLKTAQVSPYLFTLVLLAIMFVINGISDYVQMDDEFAYVYSLRFDMDLSFLALHRAFPAFAVWFVSIVCTLLGVVLNVGASLYHLGIRRGEEMPFVTLFDGFAFVGKIILLYVVQVIFISLWTLLLVIPGIVAAYRYRFAMLNLCENPDLGVMEALDLSKRQTNGYKMQLFLLQLSFIGYQLAAALIAVLYEYAIISFLPDSLPGVLLGTLIYSVLAAGVGVYLTPYLNLSICRFYLLATGNQAGGAEPPHTDPWDTPF